MGRTVIPVGILAAGRSNEVNVNDKRIVGIRMSPGWTAAAISFEALVDEPPGEPKAPVFGPVNDAAGAQITLATPAANTYLAIPDTLALVALGRIKVLSGTTSALVGQGVTRNIGLVCVDA